LTISRIDCGERHVSHTVPFAKAAIPTGIGTTNGTVSIQIFNEQ